MGGRGEEKSFILKYNWQARISFSSSQSFQYNKTLFLYSFSHSLSLSPSIVCTHSHPNVANLSGQGVKAWSNFSPGFNPLEVARIWRDFFFWIFRCKKEVIYSYILAHLLSALGPGNLLSLSHCLLSLIYPIINSSLTLIHNYGCFWGSNELLLGLNVYSSNTVSSSILIISTWKEV